MSAVTLIFPHQLFEKNPALEKGRPVFIVEEFLFFRQYNFHKQKLVFHRASMKAYQSFLHDEGYAVNYIESHHENADTSCLLPYFKEQNILEIHLVELADNWLHRRLMKQAAQLNLNIVEHDSPGFLLTRGQVNGYFSNKQHFHQTDFYTRLRKYYRILVNENLQPWGGKWTFDAENRLKYPKGKTPPSVHFPEANGYWKEALAYVEKHFSSNYGQTGEDFIYPTTFKESRAWLDQFLDNRFAEFGDFEDALVSRESILNHSVLTPMMNAGLLTPGEVLKRAISYAGENDVPLNSLEGFVRQILGWREFVRGVYDTTGVEQRTTNYWKFKRKIPASFWNATTGIGPLDDTISKVLKTGYCHHIERLMVLGNFMLLCEFDPDEVYRWFMELFIDSYDWVMVPNVYGMSQFADGGLMATKPYISGSNYLMKMSDYKKGDWQLTWDSLFWRFMHIHRSFFLKNPRLGMLVATFDKMPEQKRNEHLSRAAAFLETLDAKDS